MDSNADAEWPAALEDSRSAGLGVIAAYRFRAADAKTPPAFRGVAVSTAKLGEVLDELFANVTPNEDDRGGEFVWYHLSSRADHARNWLSSCRHVAAGARDFLLDTHAVPGRVEAIAHDVAGCLSDLAYDFTGDPSEIRSFRFFVTERILITVREEPIATTNRLRLAIRDGRTFSGPRALLNELLGYQADALRALVDDAEDRLEHIEDRIFGGAQTVEEGALSRIRWLCGRLQRRFAPEHKVLAQLRRTADLHASGIDVEVLVDRMQQFEETLADVSDVQSRARLLQEEVNSRQASATGRNLYFLSIFTALMLPVTLVTGVFGMNVAGLPGTKSEDAFVWVIIGMLALAVASLAGLRLKKLI